MVGAVSSSLWLLFGAVLALLLIACTNIAALLLARATQRERDVAIRYSLGASRATVTLQLLTETAVLVLAGMVAGLGVAFGAVEAMTLLAADLPRFDEISIDERTLLYTIASAVIVTFLCGLFPALKNTRDAGSATQGSRTQVSSGQSSNWALVGVQVALSVTLLAGAGLLLRSFDALTRIDPGFDAERVLTFRLSGSFAETNDFAAVLQRIDRTLDELTALPGIEAAGTSFAVPGVPTERAQQELELVEAEAAPGSRLIAEIRTVSPSYFATLRFRYWRASCVVRPRVT